MAEKERPKRGLPAIREARELRSKREGPSFSGKFWLWALIAIAAIGTFYWKRTETENDAHRVRILTKQRVIANEAGGTYLRMRDEIEGFTVKLAKDTTDADFVDEVLTGESTKRGAPALFQRPGVYLRVARPDALSPERIRLAAKDSLKDAFTACLLHVPHLDAHKGKACTKSKECDPGQICNELDLCSVPTQPYNLRIAYRGLFVLDPDWVRDVETASDELRLRLREEELNQANASDIPIAIDLLKRAKYFLVVIDDVPEGLKPPDGGTLEQTVQGEVHPARIGLWDLEGHKMLLRVKRTVDVEIAVVPGQADALRRQALNCALAHEVENVVSTKLPLRAGSDRRRPRRGRGTRRGSPASAVRESRRPSPLEARRERAHGAHEARRRGHRNGRGRGPRRRRRAIAKGPPRRDATTLPRRARASRR